MRQFRPAGPTDRSFPLAAAALGMGLFAFHLALSGRYGFHGDELYFMVCGQRPAWGYVDHPPFTPMVAGVATSLFGPSLFALRLFPAAALGLGCFLTGWLARRLGAGTYGEALAALAFVCAPLLLRFGAILNIPSFEALFWLLAAHVVVTICRRDDARRWVAFGALAGVMLLNKHTTLFLGAGAAVGLLLTARRKDLATPWPWVGGVAAGLIFLPNLYWQWTHDWATLEFVRNINAALMQETPRALFLISQVLLMNPFNAVLCAAGLWFLLARPEGRPYALLGWIFVSALAIMLVFQAKVYYLAPAYPMIYAAGAVLIGRAGRAVRLALPAGMIAMAVLFAPIMAPIGDVGWKDRYVSRVLGFMIDDPTDLTFDFHYQLGRDEERQAFLAAYRSLDAALQADCVILTDEYDSASNVTIFGPGEGLPPAISGSNSFYLWGPGAATGECVIAMGYDRALFEECFADVRVAGAAPPVLHRGGEAPRPIYICTGPKASFAEMWPRFKRYR